MAKVPNTWLIALRVTGLGWYVAASIILGVAGGWGLDKLLGTTPIFILVGTVFGTVIAFWGLLKLVQPFLKNAADDRSDRPSDRPNDQGARQQGRDD